MTSTQAAQFSAVYGKGLKDERLVMRYISQELGKTVEASTKHQNMFEDIDCFVNGVSVSIKSQQAALKYGNLCFELSQHLTEFQDCPVSKPIIAQRTITMLDIQTLEASGSWQSSWFYNGKAEIYAMLMGSQIRTYTKQDILSHVAAKGFLKIRPLTAAVKGYQGGKTRYCDSLTGMIRLVDLKPRNVYNLSDDFMYSSN